MFKVLLLQAIHGLSDEQAEYLIRDRLVDPLCGSTMRFLGPPNVAAANAAPKVKVVELPPDQTWRYATNDAVQVR